MSGLRGVAENRNIRSLRIGEISNCGVFSFEINQKVNSNNIIVYPI